MGCINTKTAVIPIHGTPRSKMQTPIQKQQKGYVQIILNPIQSSPPNYLNISKQEQNIVAVKPSPAIPQLNASKRYEQPINTETTDGKLQAAARAFANNDPKTAIQYYELTIKSIDGSQDRTIPTMEIRAYSMAQLASLYAQSKAFVQTYHCSNEALKFYQQFQSNYYQQVITLLNNMALWKQSQKKYDEAIKTYLKIIDIVDKYLGKNDERTLLTKNNLACLYFECGEALKGKQMFKALLYQIKISDINVEVSNLIHNNHEYYRRY